MNLLEQEAAPAAEYCTIPLTRGQFAIVDACDHRHLSQWKWCAMRIRDTGHFYAVRTEKLPSGRSISILMHRLIAGLSYGDPSVVDHRNGSTLDNRRSNLRVATNAENRRNMRRRSDSSTGFKGVHFKRSSGRFCAQITLNRKKFQLGTFATPEEAHAAYKAAATKMHEEFASFG